MATVRYVAQDGTGDGSSWASATGNLQAAIDASSAGDEVWVAQGTYRPDSLIRSNKATSRTFFLKDGVSLYGGFAGTESSKDARARGENPWEMTHETILSADDDVPDTWQRALDEGTSYRYTWQLESDQIPGSTGNGTHVLYQADVISNLTVIDGFTLTGANANVWQVKACGGALYALGNVQLKNSRVIENQGYFSAQSTTDSNTYGGAVFLNGAGDARIEGCLFARNYCHSSWGNAVGGAIYAKNVTVSGCHFEDNVSLDYGGAIYNNGGTVENCTFINNYAGSGGAIYNDGTATGNKVFNCRGLLGGGIFNLGTVSYTIVANCYADAPEYGETMGGRGGGILNVDGMVLGSVVYNNQAFWGGGVYLRGGKIVNSTIQNNILRAESDTANVGFYTPDLEAMVFNSIGNVKADASNFVAPTTFVGYNEVALAQVKDASWALAEGSEFIDAGTLTDGVSETLDIAGNPRVQGQSIDVGAYEFTASSADDANLVITFTEGTKSVRLGLGGGTFSVDWGDGELTEYSSAAYYSHTITGNTVKVYGEDLQLLQATGGTIETITVNNAPALQRIQVGNNALKSLDLSGATALTGLYAEGNSLTSLDLSRCTALRVIDVHENQIGGTVDCSAMNALSKIDVADNHLTALVLPSHTTLYDVDCSNNNIETLDVTGRSGITELKCSGNLLSALDLKGMTGLTELYAYENRLTTIDVSEATALETLNVSDNELTAIDLSKNTALTGLYLYNNAISELDLSKNTKVRWLNVHDNRLAALNTSAQPSLSLLIANNNEIAAVDLTANPSLSQVQLGNNRLESIDVSRASYLSWLKVDNNRLSELNVSANSYLYWLECDSNRIASLDLSKNTYVQWVAAQDNLLDTLDVTANTGLQGLTIARNKMSVDAINAIIDALPNVSSVEITDNNRLWGRQLDISYMPGTRSARKDDATAKGWIVTALYDILRGDLNADGVVNSADVSLLYTWIINGDDANVEVGDLNGDGALNAADVVALYNIILN